MDNLGPKVPKHKRPFSNSPDPGIVRALKPAGEAGLKRVPEAGKWFPRIHWLFASKKSQNKRKNL